MKESLRLIDELQKEVSSVDYGSPCRICSTSIKSGQEFLTMTEDSFHGPMKIVSFVRVHYSCMYPREISKEEAESFFSEIIDNMEVG